MIRWGTVSTMKAPKEAILNFAAWHLELGAHRLYIYLDDNVPDTEAVLSAHPKIRVKHTDAAYWAKRKGRPEVSRNRQTANVRHANNRKVECDWLCHIDVDEFLLPQHPVADQLAELPADCLCARVRPVEALAPGEAAAPGETLFKAFHLEQDARRQAAEACFPTWGRHLSGGFLSHVAGKLFFRTGIKGLQVKIHNMFLKDEMNIGERALTGTELGHFHAADWDHFREQMRWRLATGSYRPELKAQTRAPGALNLHALLGMINDTGGEAALRLFFDEVCTATPELVSRLEAQGLLRRHEMQLDQLRARHFPNVKTG
ncbi:glycosyltransferase family 2 protein [Antarctobacter jejuensis]|uniref:glycosyltransferase family 2 protein n=1 Tax=Antarctobacter jejuensis TaxID=1439938 RepID=UPI003FCFB981